MSNTLIAVNFHYVRQSFDLPYPAIHGITPDQLEAQLRLLAGLGTFVSGSEIREAIDGGRRLPDRSFIVTFDDGLSEQIDYALPVLETLSVPALFFVNTRPIEAQALETVHKIHWLRSQVEPRKFVAELGMEAAQLGVELLSGTEEKARELYPYDSPAAAELKFLLNVSLPERSRDSLIQSLFERLLPDSEEKVSNDLYMSVDQLKQLAKRDMLGSHGHRHVPMGALTSSEAYEDIVRSLDLLEQWTGKRPFALSYPYGSREACPENVTESARQASMSFGFTMERAANRNFDHPFRLGRFDCNDLPGGKRTLFEPQDLFSQAPDTQWPNSTSA